MTWLMWLACAPPPWDPQRGPMLAATEVLCELYNNQTRCATIVQEHYPTQDGVDNTLLRTLSMSGSLVCGVDAASNIACGGFDKNDILVEPTGGFKDVAAGNSHACALDLDGVPKCWGADYAYALEAPAGVRLDSLVAGDNRTCGYAKATGEWSCWGYDRYWLEQAGVTLDVPADGTVLTSMSMYGIELFGVREDGTLGYWGWPADATYEVWTYGMENVPTGGGYVRVDVGTWHVCALHETGRIDCWGDNRFGQSDVPDGTWTDVAAGETFTCGRKTDDTIQCWGCGGTCYRESPNLP